MSGTSPLPTWAVMCGAIRRLVEFKFSIGELVRLRHAGLVDEIVLSTWNGEIDAHDGLRASLLDLGIHIVECAPPANIGAWAIFGQHKNMLEGLAICPADCFVFKHRTDKAFEMTWSFHDFLVNGPPRTAGAEQYGGFRHKVVCTRFSTTLPLYVADFSFLIYSRDLRQLLNFDGYFDNEVVGTALPEMRWFAPPFIRASKFLDWWFRHVALIELSEALMAYAADGAKEPLPDVIRDAVGLGTRLLDDNFITTLSEGWSPGYDGRSLFTVPEPGFAGPMTQPGQRWTLMMTGNLLGNFIRGEHRRSLPNLDAIAEAARGDVQALCDRTVSQADMDEVRRFSERWRPGAPFRSDAVHTAAGASGADPEAATAALRIWADIGIGEEEFRSLRPSIESTAGGYGVPFALRHAAMGWPATDDLQSHRFKLLEAAANLQDLESALLLAEHYLEERTPEDRLRAESYVELAADVARRFDPGSLGRVDALRERLESS